MSLSYYNPNDRYRQRAARRMIIFLGFGFFFAAIFGFGFWVGGIRSQQNMYILQEEKRIISEERDHVQAEMTKMRAESQTAKVRLEQLRANYDELLGNGAMKDLVSLLRQQIDQGVDMKRLQSVLSSARPPQNCSAPQTKRFVVDTPVYNGPSSRVALPGDVVVVTANGASSQNSQGRKEAWFDPSQPVELSFTIKDGKTETKKGILPLYHTVVHGDKEYRFTATIGDKSFVRLTHDHCDYP
jgi:cell division protein FtsB